MKTKVKYLLLFTSISFLLILSSCADDEFVVNFEGRNVFGISRFDLNISGNYGEMNISNSGFITCTFIRVSYAGFAKNYSFHGFLHTDTSVTVNIAPIDSLAKDRLKLEAKVTGITIAGKIYYCPDADNCSFVEIGNMYGHTWFYLPSNHFVGFYYSPLFYGEFDIQPSVVQPKSQNQHY